MASTLRQSGTNRIANTLSSAQSRPRFWKRRRTPWRGSKLAAKAGARYLDLLKANEEIVGKQVTENIYERHLRPLFIG